MSNDLSLKHRLFLENLEEKGLLPPRVKIAKTLFWSVISGATVFSLAILFAFFKDSVSENVLNLANFGAWIFLLSYAVGLLVAFISLVVIELGLISVKAIEEEWRMVPAFSVLYFGSKISFLAKVWILFCNIAIAVSILLFVYAGWIVWPIIMTILWFVSLGLRQHIPSMAVNFLGGIKESEFSEIEANLIAEEKNSLLDKN